MPPFVKAPPSFYLCSGVWGAFTCGMCAWLRCKVLTLQSQRFHPERDFENICFFFTVFGRLERRRERSYSTTTSRSAEKENIHICRHPSAVAAISRSTADPTPFQEMIKKTSGPFPTLSLPVYSSAPRPAPRSGHECSRGTGGSCGLDGRTSSSGSPGGGGPGDSGGVGGGGGGGTPEERERTTKEKNRDHSRKSRERKKVMLEGLKKKVLMLFCRCW